MANKDELDVSDDLNLPEWEKEAEEFFNSLEGLNTPSRDSLVTKAIELFHENPHSPLSIAEYKTFYDFYMNMDMDGLLERVAWVAGSG